MSRLTGWLTALGGVLLLGGCMVGPDFQRPEVPWLADWSGGSLAALSAEQRGKPPANTETWWRNFNDPVLEKLVAEALRVNPNVRTAGMRILEALAQLGIAESTLYPQLQQLTGELARAGQQKDGVPNIAFTGYKTGLTIGWELDFWGKFRRSVEAADANYFANVAQYDAMQVLMAAQTASIYALIRTLEARLRIAQENAALQKRSLEITERLFKSGNDSELDLQQAKSQYLGTLATIPQLEGSLRQAQNALSALLARAPGPLPEVATHTAQIPEAELGVIIDIPADLLRRRPDVRATELQLAAQSALIGVSEAELYPSISLLGSVGLSASSLAWSRKTLDWVIGSSLVWNVFDYGRLTNQVLVQDARFQQLHEQYQEAVLQAAREVDDAAVGFAKGRAQVPLLVEAVKAARRSLDIATIQYREGMTDFQRVLDSQKALFGQQERLVAIRGEIAQSLIAVYKALGGGWEQGRSRPLLDAPTREILGERSSWKGLLEIPLPPPGADPPFTQPGMGAP